VGAHVGTESLDVKLKADLSGSTLGLQRSVQIALGRHHPQEPEAALSFTDVSVLGLQRSAKIVPGKKKGQAKVRGAPTTQP